MLISLPYLILRRVLELVALRCRSNAFKELEIVEDRGAHLRSAALNGWSRS